MSDSISRQTVLDMLEDINAETEGVGFYYDHWVKYIKQLPSAERTGHWIELYENNYQCSECNAWWTCEDTPIASGMNFCPNCGARMVSEDE